MTESGIRGYHLCLKACKVYSNFTCRGIKTRENPLKSFVMFTFKFLVHPISSIFIDDVKIVL